MEEFKSMVDTVKEGRVTVMDSAHAEQIANFLGELCRLSRKAIRKAEEQRNLDNFITVRILERLNRMLTC